MTSRENIIPSLGPPLPLFFVSLSRFILNAEYALQYAIKNKTGQTCIINNAEYALQYAIMNKTGQYMHNQ